MSLATAPRAALAGVQATTRNRVWAGACILLVTLQLHLIWSHVPWLDELQAYLLARDTQDLAGWWSNFRYEGHAPLWHLLVKLCLVAVDGPASLKLALSLCAGTTCALLLLAAPFSWALRLLLCANYFLLFEYGVIARDYSLGVALALAVVAFRSRWISWGLLALVPQAGLQFEMIAGLLLLMQIADGRRPPMGLLVVLAGMALALLQMHPNADTQTIGGMIAQGSIWSRVNVSAFYVGTALVPVDLHGRLLGWLGQVGPKTIALMLGAAAIHAALATTACRRMPIFAWGLPLFLAASMGLSVFVYSLATRHFGLTVLVLIIALWRHPERWHGNGAARVWLGLLALGGGATLAHGAWTPFSSAPQIAQRLQQPDLAGLPIIPIDTMLGVEPSAYLGVKTVNMTNACWQSFVRWKGPVFLPPLQGRATWTRGPEAARDAYQSVQQMAARLGGRAVVILDRKAQARLAPVSDAAMVPIAQYTDVIGAGKYRYMHVLSVPPAAMQTPLPDCAS